MKTTLLFTLLLTLAACNNQKAEEPKTTPEPTVKACTKDLKVCPDGQSVGRDPANQCEFEACPEPVTGCPDDVKQCPDGRFVERDPALKCKFKSCDQPNDVVYCTQDVKQCPDGSYVGRDNTKNCAFKPCPESDGHLE